MRVTFAKPAGELLASGHHGIGWDGIASLGALFMARFRKADLVPFGTLDQAGEVFVPMEVIAATQPRPWSVTLRLASIPPDGSDDAWAPGTTLRVVGAKFSTPSGAGMVVPTGDLWIEGSDDVGWPVVGTRSGDDWPDDDLAAMSLVEPAAAAVWGALADYLASRG